MSQDIGDAPALYSPVVQARSRALSQQAADQLMVEVTRANRQVYYQGDAVKLPTPYGDRKFYRTITDDAFLLTDPSDGEIVFSFPLPMVALNVQGRYISSYAIQGVEVARPTKQWQRKHAEYEQQFAQRQEELPEVITAR